MNWIQGLLIASIFALLVFLLRSRRSVQSQAWVKVGFLLFVLAGDPGPVRDAVLLNAGAALVAHRGSVGDLVADVREMVQRATEASGSPTIRR